MQRRALLAATGTIAASLAGCLDGPGSDVDGPEWSHNVGGSVDAVTDDRVFFTEAVGDDSLGDGSLTALGAADGEHLWSYGSTDRGSSFTDLTIADAVYVGYYDGTVGGVGEGDLYAVEFDGTERWSVDTGNVHERPHVRDDVVYVGSDEGVVWAIDANAGEVRWRHEVETPESGGSTDPTVEAVDEAAVYVDDDSLIALDPATGDRRWRFGDEDIPISSVAVHGGVAYVGEGSSVSAVEDGEELWSAPIDARSFPRVFVDDGRVFVEVGMALWRLDAADGRVRWRVDVDDLLDWTVHDDRLYATGNALHALDVGDGERIWTESVADGMLGRVQIATDADVTSGDDHAVFVEREDDDLHRVSPDGEVTWSVSFTWDLRNFVVDGLVCVGTDEGVAAYDTE